MNNISPQGSAKTWPGGMEQDKTCMKGTGLERKDRPRREVKGETDQGRKLTEGQTKKERKMRDRPRYSRKERKR